jgi:hypothetical protein
VKGKRLAEEVDHEGSSFGQENVRELQGDPPPRRGAGHLPQSQAQATARMKNSPPQSVML